MKPLIESRWKYLEYECAILCIPYGHRCGYVGIPNTHPLYEVDYMDVYKNNSNIEVHGSLTYSGFGNFKYPVFQNVKNAKWFFGFDTAHYGDAIDHKILEMFGMPIQRFYSRNGTVKTNNYCVNEVKKLAKQLKCMED